MTIFADEGVERFVSGARAPKPPGPEMAVEDRTIGHVPVRIYAQGPKRVVYLHGGGFVRGDLDSHDPLCRRLAAATGATVVAVDYRRAPEHPYPAAVEDALAVIDEVRPVAVAGDSAGAFIGALAARRTAVRLEALLLVCPHLDLMLAEPSAEEFGHGFTLDVDELREWVSWWAPEAAAVPNPLQFDLEGMPPALIVAAALDPLRDGAVAFAERLRGAGVAADLRIEAGLVHNHPTYAHLSPAAERAYARFLTDAATILR